MVKITEAEGIDLDSQLISADNMISDFKSICRLYMGRERFIDNDSFLLAVKVIAGITKGFDDLPLDDSDGGTSCFYMRVVELLNTILSHNDHETNDFVFNWISRAIADERNWYLSEILQPVWESQFKGPEAVESMLVPFMCSESVLEWLADLARSNNQQDKEYELLKEGYELAKINHHPGTAERFGSLS